MPPSDLAAWAEEILAPLDDWAGQCHAASLKLVRHGDLGACRVARGACRGVLGQHSWVVLGDDCYDKLATIIDPTLWSYTDKCQASGSAPTATTATTRTAKARSGAGADLMIRPARS